MCLTSPSTAAVLVLAATVAAQSTICAGLNEPNWDDCNALLDPYLDGPGSFPAVGPPACFGATEGNCLLNVCPNEEIPIDGQRVRSALVIMRSICEPAGSGGEHTVSDPNGFRVVVKNNPEFVAPPFPSSAANRSHARQFEKRYQEGDDTFELDAMLWDITRPGFMYPLSSTIPGGSSYEYTITETITKSVSSGIMGGAADVFSVGASVEVTNSYSISSAEGVSINVNCPASGRAQVYWEPTFTRYDGNFRPSGDFQQVWIPVNGGGQFTYQCLG